MRILYTAAVVGLSLAAAPAFAWNENMTQPATNNMAVWAYPAKANYCPAGLQPVVVGGVICCGQPTHHGYQSHPPRKRHKVVHKPKPAPTYVSYGKGYGDGTVVYEKGQ